jgi:hypothetical protein
LLPLNLTSWDILSTCGPTSDGGCGCLSLGRSIGSVYVCTGEAAQGKAAEKVSYRKLRHPPPVMRTAKLTPHPHHHHHTHTHTRTHTHTGGTAHRAALSLAPTPGSPLRRAGEERVTGATPSGGGTLDGLEVGRLEPWVVRPSDSCP